MVQRWAVANGNWSNSATWNGGTLPGPTDDVYANNFTVTIDQNITANSLNIVAGTTAVQGGTFQCSTSRTIALQKLEVGAFSGTSAALLLLTAGSAVVTIAGMLSGDTASGGAEPRTISITGGNHTITAGTCTGGLGPAIEITGSSDTDITADVVGSGLGSSPSINMAHSGAAVTLHGTVAGGALAVGVQVSNGTLRLDAEVIYGAGCVPLYALSGSAGIIFKRGGGIAMTAPSDDDWPAITGDPITLGTGGDPHRFINVGGDPYPIQ